MESHRCGSSASDHSESTTSSSNHEQRCSQMPQQIVFNSPFQGHRHPAGHGHILPQQGRVVIPQQYAFVEQNVQQNMQYGLAQGQRAVVDNATVCTALTCEISGVGKSVSPAQSLSDVKSHQRHISSHEQTLVYNPMPEPSTTACGQVHHSPAGMHQHIEMSGQMPGCIPPTGYYPVPHQVQHMPNSGKWQRHGLHMSPGGQTAVPGQVFVSGVRARFNTHMSVPARGQHPQYAMNQEYSDGYCSQYHTVYGGPNSGSAGSCFPPVQQQNVATSGPHLMFARSSHHPSHLRPRVPAQYYPADAGNASCQQLSASWSGSAHMMRPGVAVGYGAWQRPAAGPVPVPGHHVPAYHTASEPRMTPQYYDNFGGARQCLSPSGSVYYRPSSNPNTTVNVDETCHMPAGGNHTRTACTQECVSSSLCSASTNTVVCSTAGSAIASKDTGTVVNSHQVGHLPDNQTSVSQCGYVSGPAASSHSLYNRPEHYSHGSNANYTAGVSYPASAIGDYGSYSAPSPYVPQQHTTRHVNPYNYYASSPRGPYTSVQGYSPSRCGHQYQARTDGMQWQEQVAVHPFYGGREVYPAKMVSQQPSRQELFTATETSSGCQSVASTGSALHVNNSVLSTPASLTVDTCVVEQLSVDNSDKVNVTVTVQSSASNTDYHVPNLGNVLPAENRGTLATQLLSSSHFSVPVSTAVNDRLATTPRSDIDSMCVFSSSDSVVPSLHRDMVQGSHSKNELADTAGYETEKRLFVSSSSFSNTSNALKAGKRRGSRKASGKTKKTKLPVDINKVYEDEFKGTSGEVVEWDAPKATLSEFNPANSLSRISDVHMDTRLKKMGGHCDVTSKCSEQSAVVVPYGWRRHVDSTAVVYYSPSNACLRSHEEVRQYLLKDGTCKCGLQCPLSVDKTFVFDGLQTQSRHLLADDIHAASDPSNSLCNHRRKIIAMARFQQSTGFHFTKPETTAAAWLPVTTALVAVTSVSEFKLSHDSFGSSASHSMSHISRSVVDQVCVASDQAVSAFNPSYGSCYSDVIATMCSSTTAVTYMPCGTGSGVAYTYNPMHMQSVQARSQQNPSGYHPSVDFPPELSSSYHRMAAFPPHRMLYTTSGPAVYANSVAGSSLSANVLRHCGGVYAPSHQAVAVTTQHQIAFQSSTVSGIQEPVRTPAAARSKKKSHSQQKEPYSSILERSVPCPNIDVRQIIQEQRERLQMEAASCSAGGGYCTVSFSTSSTPAVRLTSGLVSCQTVTMSSPNLPITSSPFVSTLNNVAVTGSESVSVVVSTSDDVHLQIDFTTSSVFSNSSYTNTDVSAAVSSSSAHAASGTVATNVSANVPVSSCMSRGTSWVCVEPHQYSQYTSWSQFASHPLSCVPGAKSSFGVNLYDRQSQQVTSLQPSTVLKPNVSDVLEASVASSAWLPVSAVSESVKDESPIRLVQNMVSGLETTQNSLAMAAALIINQSDSVPRRRRSGASDTSAAALTNATSCEDVKASSEPVSSDIQASSLCHLPVSSASGMQTTAHQPGLSTVTVVTSVLTQVLPAASIVPSVYAGHLLTSASVSTAVAAAKLSHAANVTAVSSAENVESCVVSDLLDADSDSVHVSGTSASNGETAQQLMSYSAVVDDDETTQDCDVSAAGADCADVLCTTGTQTSTPPSGLSNCNSVESIRDGTDSLEPTATVGPMFSAADSCPSADVQPDTVACGTAELYPSPKPPDNVHPRQIPVPTSTPVVLIPRVPQTSFLLPQNIAFASNPIVGHGFLQFQPPGEFGYGAGVQSSNAGPMGQPSAVGLVHFAAGPMVGPAVGNMMAASDPSGSFRFMTPVKSDGDAYSAAEFLPLMPAALPAGHILLQNIVPTGLAPTIVPFVQPAALCSLPVGSSALFAVSQGSVMSVGAPLAFASVPVPEETRELCDHAPDQPDSTVDNSEMDVTDEQSSDDSADTEQVTSTDEPLDKSADDPESSAVNDYSASRTVHNAVECSDICSRVSGDIAGGSHVLHSKSLQRSRSLMPTLGLKKRTRLSRSRMKMRHSRSLLKTVTVAQMSCSSSQSGLKTQMSATMSPLMREDDGLALPGRSSSPQNRDDAASDSSVSTTLSLHDCGNDALDPNTGGKCSSNHVGSAQKASWKKKALVRRTRLRLRHSKLEEKQPVETSTMECHAEDVADSTTGSGLSSPRTFSIGDLVWGPSRGFPSWPGKLVSELEVRGNHKLESGKIWVKWFGDHTFTQADPDQLKTLSEGLDTHHNARKKDRQGRKMNSNLEAAIQEAMVELDRQMAEQSAVRSVPSSAERNQKSQDGKKRK